MKFLNIVKRKNEEIRMLQREMERVQAIDEQLRKQWTDSINIVMQHNQWLGVGRRMLTVLNRSNGRMIVVNERIDRDVHPFTPPNPVKPYRSKRPVNSCKSKPTMFDPNQPFQTSDDWNPVFLYKHRIKLK
jgi:hypothetical protein